MYQEDNAIKPWVGLVGKQKDRAAACRGKVIGLPIARHHGPSIPSSEALVSEKSELLCWVEALLLMGDEVGRGGKSRCSRLNPQNT